MNKKIQIRKPYDAVGRVHPEQSGELLVKQEFRDEVNINNIVAKSRAGQLVTHLNEHHGQYGDFSFVPDYQTAIEMAREAQDMFMSLPADVRKRFDNDPGMFLEFAQDPRNADELVKMGLAEIPQDQRKPPSEAAPQDQTGGDGVQETSVAAP